MRTYPHSFRHADLVAGHVVLDLTNTVTARGDDPVDWLDGYPRALEWARLTGHFDDRVLADLEGLSAAERQAAADALGRLRELREAVYEVVVAAIRHEGAPPQALERVERFWKEAAQAGRLEFAGGHARLEPDPRSSHLDYLAHELALRALELLRDLPLDRTRACASGCGWLFIDRSKGGRRRWCDMATCGNAAKSRRHYEKRRAGKAA